MDNLLMGITVTLDYINTIKIKLNFKYGFQCLINFQKDLIYPHGNRFDFGKIFVLT